MKNTIAVRKYQQGAVLLVMFLMLFTVATTVFLSSVDTNQVEVRQQQDVRIEMEKAKQALIAYAQNYPHFGFDNDDDGLTNDEGIGRLICPDVDNDGLADSNDTDCTDNVRGRLPERFTYGGSSTTTVTLNNYFADIDQQFWYVVSPAFKEITDSNVNHRTSPTLSIDGEQDYVAVIIAPGEAIGTQNRSAGQTTVANYLEYDNVSGSDFINSYPSDPDNFNDQVIGITADEIFAAIDVEEMVIEYAIDELENYWATNGFQPETTSDLSDFIETNGSAWYSSWFAHESYVDEFNNFNRNDSPYDSYDWSEFSFYTCPSTTVHYLTDYSTYPPLWYFFPGGGWFPNRIEPIPC